MLLTGGSGTRQEQGSRRAGCQAHPNESAVHVAELRSSYQIYKLFSKAVPLRWTEA